MTRTGINKRQWVASVMILVTCSAQAEGLGNEFPALRYPQEIVFTFPSNEAAESARISMAPLFDGYVHAVGSRWDDNCLNDLKMKECLDGRGVKATWYLNVAPFETNPGAEEFLPAAQKLLENGHSIGVHSYSHPYISYAHRNRMFQEMAAARVAWEALLDTPVLSYTFSYVDFRSPIEGDPVQTDLIRLLERAGFYHLAEFKTFDDVAPSEMILSVILPPENNDLETFKKAVDWAMEAPELGERFPGMSHSMHAWYGTERSPYGWDEMEQRLDYVNGFPEVWHCNHNQYAAYRYQFLHTDLEVSREGAEIRVRLNRPVLRFLNDAIPLTLSVETDGADVLSAACGTADVARSGRSASGRTLFNVNHDRGQQLPAKIGRVENPSNRRSPTDKDVDADFPGLRALLSAGSDGLHLEVVNMTDTPLENVSVTYRLPLRWVEGVKVTQIDRIEAGANWSDTWSPTPRTGDPKYSYGAAYVVAQVDFQSNGQTGRLHTTCSIKTDSDTSFPKDGFAVMGPFDPAHVDLAALDAALAAKGVPESWPTADGTQLTWRDNSDDGPIDQALFDPEVVRTLGSWYYLESPMYFLSSRVHSAAEQPILVQSSPGDLRRVYLNGHPIENARAVLKPGENELLAVYHCVAVGGSPRHAGCWLRLADPQTGERLRDIRYERPAQAISKEAGALNVALLQMLPAGNDQESNLRKGDAFCREAAGKGADIALFPEMFNIGYTPFHGTDSTAVSAWQAQAVGLDSPYVGHFRALARDLDMAIGLTYLQAIEGAPRNAITLIDRHGEIRFTYAKVHTCDFSNFEASTTPGDDFYVATLDTRLGPVSVGAMICFDREFPESARILMLKGAEIIVTPNACLLDDIRHNQFQSRALENSVAVFMTNYPAPLHGGRSVAFGPNGECLAKAEADECITVASIDLAYLREYRKKSIWGNAFRRPHRYGALVDSTVDPVWQRLNGLGEPFKREQR